jgi:hypothetical protein
MNPAKTVDFIETNFLFWQKQLISSKQFFRFGKNSSFHQNNFFVLAKTVYFVKTNFLFWQKQSSGSAGAARGGSTRPDERFIYSAISLLIV